MTRLTLSFPDPQAVVLTSGHGLSLSLPDPQPVTLQVQGIQGAPGSGGGGGVTDGDKGDITVSGSGTVWTIDAGAVTLSDMANLAATSLIGNSTGAPATPAALSPATVKGMLAITTADVSGLATIATSGSASDLGAGTLPAARFNDTAHGVRAGGTLHPDATTGVSGFMSGADKTKLNGIATGATANAADSALRDRSTHTGTQAAATISDFAEAVDDRVAVLAVAGTNMTITYNDALGTLTFDAAGGGAGTNLSYTASTRVIASDTGTDATLPLVTSGDAGLAPASGGGTTNFLRADGTWAAPGGGGATNLAWVAGTSTVTSDTGTDATLTVADGTNPGLMTSANFTKLAGVATGATANATDAALRDRATHTGTQLAATVSDFTEAAQDAVGGMVDASLTYVDGTPLLQRAALTGAVTAAAGSNATSLGSFTKAQLNTAVSDGDPLYVGDVTSNATHTGDVTGATALTIANDAVTNAKLANVATATIKGRVTAATGDPEDLTGTQATTLLDTFTSALKGLAPASGGGTTNFLRADGTWAAAGGGSPVTVQDEGSNITTALGTLNFVGAGVTVTGGATATVTIPGGSGSPGGSSGEVQFNNAGAFAGAADVEIEGGQLRLPAIAPPTAPAAGGLKMFARDVGGRILPASMGPSGLDSPLQPHLALNAIAMAQPRGQGVGIDSFGTAMTATGTATAKNWASTNLYTQMRGLNYLVTVAATNAIAGFRGSDARWMVGGNAAERGGFHFVCRWGPATGVATATTRSFVGLWGTNTAPTDVEPSTLLNIVGMGWDAADTNIQFMHNDGSGACTKIDLGASFPVPTVDAQEVYEIVMFSPPGTTQSVTYRIRNLRTAVEATGTVTTNLPLTTQTIVQQAWMSVGGTSSVIGITLFKVYIETDY
jgi:hypothetical protein